MAKLATPPPRRKPTKIAASIVLDIAPPPIAEGVDAVVGWINRLNLQTIDLATQQPLKHKAIQALVASFGRCRATARDVGLLLRAREQRDRIPVATAYAVEPPLTDSLAMPLWHAFELVRLLHLVMQAEAVDKEDLAAIQTRARHHVAGVQVREAGVTADFKRRHRIGNDVARAVEDYAQIQAQLEKEQLTAGDAADARDDLIAYGKFMKSDFIAPWHIQVVADALMKAERREIRGLIINMPPRRGKTVLASELFISWYLGRHPSHDIILGTLSQTFADSLGRKVRNTIQSPEYRRVFPGVNVAGDSSAAAVFEVIEEGASSRQRRGNFKAFGREAGMTGSGSSVLLLDDLLSELDAYSATERAKLVDNLIAFRTRLAPDAIWIVINTRYHEDDVVGVVKRDFDKDREWHVVTLPEFAETDEEWIIATPATERRPAQRKIFTRKTGEVLWPERFSAESSEQLKAALLKVAPHKWWGQFQCRPVPSTGAMVDVAWFRRYDYADVMQIVKQASRVVVSVDTGGVKLSSRGNPAYGARTAITAWAEWEDGKLYLLDVRAEPWIYPDMIQAVKDCCADWHPTDLLIENKAAGVELIKDLSEQRNWVQTPITPIDPFGPKETRLSVATPQIRAGQVYIPAQGACADLASVRGAAPAWVVEFLTELGHFPLGSRKDIVDSTSQILNWRRENPIFSNFGEVTATSPAKQALMAAIAGPFGQRGGAVQPRQRIGVVRRG